MGRNSHGITTTSRLMRPQGPPTLAESQSPKSREILPEPIGSRAPTSTRTTEPTDAPPNPAPTLSSTGVFREPTVPGGAATSSPLPTTSESMATQLPTSSKNIEQNIFNLNF